MKLGCALFCSVALIFSNIHTVYADNHDEKTLTLLAKGEFYSSMLTSQGYTFVGKARTGWAPDYRIEIYDPQLKLATKVALTHAPMSIHQIDKQSIITYGINPNIAQVQYTIIDTSSPSFPSTTSSLGENAWANGWLGKFGNDHFFIDVGGNVEDDVVTRSPGSISQTIVRLREGVSSYLDFRISRPIAGIKSENGFYVAQGHGIGSGRSDLLQIDLENGLMKSIFKELPTEIRDMVLVESASTLVIADSAQGRLIGIDTKTDTFAWQMPTGSSPATLATAGKCVVLGDMHEKLVHVVDVSGSSPVVLHVESIKSPETQFRGLSKVTVDLQTKRVFARSNIPCNPILEECPNDFNRVIVLENEGITKALSRCE